MDGIHLGIQDEDGNEGKGDDDDALDPWQEAIWLTEVKLTWPPDGVGGDTLRTSPLAPVWPLSSAIVNDSRGRPRSETNNQSSPQLSTQPQPPGSNNALLDIQDLAFVDVAPPKEKEKEDRLEAGLVLCVALNTSAATPTHAKASSTSPRTSRSARDVSLAVSGTRVIQWEIKGEPSRATLSPAFSHLGTNSPVGQELSKDQSPFGVTQVEGSQWMANALADTEVPGTVAQFVPATTGWATMSTTLLVAHRSPVPADEEPRSFLCPWSPGQDLSKVVGSSNQVPNGTAHTDAPPRTTTLRGSATCIPAFSYDLAYFAQLSLQGKLVLQRLRWDSDGNQDTMPINRLRQLKDFGPVVRPKQEYTTDEGLLRTLAQAAQGNRGARTLLECAAIVRFFDQSHKVARANTELLHTGTGAPNPEGQYVIDHVFTLLNFSEWIREHLCYLFRLALLYVEVEADAKAVQPDVEVDWPEDGHSLWVRSLLGPVGCDLWLRATRHVLAFHQWLRRSNAPQAHDFLDLLPTTLQSRAAGFVGPQGQKVTVTRLTGETTPSVPSTTKVPWLDPSTLKNLLDQAKVVSHVLQQEAHNSALNLTSVATLLEVRKSALNDPPGPIWDPYPSTQPSGLAALFASLADDRNGCIDDGLSLMLSNGGPEAKWDEDWLRPLEGTKADRARAGGVADLAYPPPARDIFTKERLPALTIPSSSSTQGTALPPATPGGGLDALAPTPAVSGSTPLPLGVTHATPPVHTQPPKSGSLALAVCTACGGMTRPLPDGSLAACCLCGGKWFAL